jgi:hypothetical protein
MNRHRTIALRGISRSVAVAIAVLSAGAICGPASASGGSAQARTARTLTALACPDAPVSLRFHLAGSVDGPFFVVRPAPVDVLLSSPIELCVRSACRLPLRAAPRAAIRPAEAEIAAPDARTPQYAPALLGRNFYE